MNFPKHFRGLFYTCSACCFSYFRDSEIYIMDDYGNALACTENMDMQAVIYYTSDYYI